MRKKIALSLLAAAALIAGATPALAGDLDPVYVLPFCPDCGPYEVLPGQEIYIVSGWFATTKGLVRVYLNHAEESLALRDNHGDDVWSVSPKEYRAAYTPIYAVGEDDLASWYQLDCPMPIIYEADVLFVPPQLAEGTYSLEWRSDLTRPVNDGLHACAGIGWEGYAAPSLYRGEAVVVSTIIVK